MIHARDTEYMKYVEHTTYGWIVGLDRGCNKHNTHHVITNTRTADPDINNQPFLFLWAPSKALDHHLRRYQHIYDIPLYSVCFIHTRCSLIFQLLYASWRLQSFQYAWARKKYLKIVTVLVPSCIWLAYVPFSVAVGFVLSIPCLFMSYRSVLLAGFLVAVVVTMSHESEDILDDFEPSFVVNQFRTTRDVACPDPITVSAAVP